MVIQALGFSQIFTPFANAQPDALRVGQKAESGLEELKEELTTKLDRDIADVLVEGRRVFPESDYGWAEILRHPRSQIVPATYPFPSEDDSLDIQTLGLRFSRELTRDGRYQPSFDCVECSYWLLGRFHNLGYRDARVAEIRTPLWQVDFAVDIEGHLVSLTPGVNPQHSQVQKVGFFNNVQQRWAERSTTLPIEGEITPWTWQRKGELELLLSGGINLHEKHWGSSLQPDDPFHLILQADLVKEGQSIQRVEISYRVPLGELHHVQERLRGLSPEAAASALELKANLTSLTGGVSLSDSDQQALEAFVTEQSDLVYHTLTKLDSNWTASFSETGLEEFRELGFYKPTFVDSGHLPKFGTDGVPGFWTEENVIQEKKISRPVAYRMGLGAALLALSKGKRKVMVAADPRPSSKPLLLAVIDALKQMGLEVVVLNGNGMTTSPLALQAIGQDPEVGAGIVITGSHLSANQNRIKVILESGHKLRQDDWEPRIMRLIHAEDLQSTLVSLAQEIGVSLLRFQKVEEPSGRLPKGVVQPVRAYASQVVEASRRIFRAVGVKAHHSIFFPVDLANGAGVYVIPGVLKNLTFLQTEYLNRDRSGRRINEKCGADLVDKERVLPAGAEKRHIAGRIFHVVDGDADRYYGITEGEDGELIFIDGDRTAAIFARFIQHQLKVLGLGEDLRIGYVQTPYGDDSARVYLEEKLGVFVAEYVATGEKNVLERVERGLAQGDFKIGIGFEPNGHGFLIFSDEAKTAIRNAEVSQAKEILEGIIDLYQGAIGGDALRHALMVQAAYEFFKAQEPMRTPADFDNPEFLYGALFGKHLEVNVSNPQAIETQVDPEKGVIVLSPQGLHQRIDAILAKYPGAKRHVVRPSGTAPIARAFVIGTIREDVLRAVTEIKQLLLQHPVINPTGPEELGKSVPLNDVQVIYPGGAQKDFSKERAVFVVLMAGRANRFERSIQEAGREQEFALRDEQGNFPATKSKLLISLQDPQDPTGAAVFPAASIPIGGARALGLPVIAVVGYQMDHVMETYGSDITYVLQTDEAGNPTPDGTGAAFWRAAAAGNLRNAEDTWIIGTAGDQTFYDGNLWERLLQVAQEEERKGEEGADLILVTTVFPEGRDTQGHPLSHGKGRIVRDRRSAALSVIEQPEIDDAIEREREVPQAYRQAGYDTWEKINEIREVSMSGYVMKAKRFFDLLAAVNNNAQGEYYVTDIIQHARLRAEEVPYWQARDITTVDEIDVANDALREHRDELRWQRTLSGLEEGLSPIERLHRDLFSIDLKKLGKEKAVEEYRRVMTELSRVVEPGHLVNQNMLFFIRIGEKLHLGEPQGSITTMLFNHAFRSLGLNVAMIPVDFALAGGTTSSREANYLELVSLILEDEQSVGFAAGHPMKEDTPRAVEAWAQGRVDTVDLKKVLQRFVQTGGVLKTQITEGGRPLGDGERGLSTPLKMSAIQEGRRPALNGLMTSGKAWVWAVEKAFLKDGAPPAQRKANFIIFGAAGATGEDITRALVESPYVGELYLVEHPSKATDLKRLGNQLRMDGLDRNILSFLSTRDEEILRRHGLHGLNELDPLVGSTHFILDATAGANPIRSGAVKGIGSSHTVFTLTYRPDPHVGLWFAADQGADTRNGVNLLVADNLFQIHGILVALGFSEEEASRLSREKVEPAILTFLEGRGLEPQSLTEEIKIEEELKRVVRKKVHWFQAELVPDRLIDLLQTKGQGERPVLTFRIRERETLIGLLDPQGKPVSGTMLVRLETPQQEAKQFFPELLRVAREQLFQNVDQKKRIGGVAVGINGKVEPDGILNLSHLKGLDGRNVAQLLDDAVRMQGIQGPIVLINNTQAASRGVEPFPSARSLHFTIRRGAIGGSLWDGKEGQNLEPGETIPVKLPGGESKKLEEVAADPKLVAIAELVKRQDRDAIRTLEQAIAPLAENMVRLAADNKVQRITIGGELADQEVYRIFLRSKLRQLNPALGVQFVEVDDLTYLRGAQRFFYQVDTQALLKALLGVVIDEENSSQLRAMALRILREVLRSGVLAILRQRGDRFADHVLQAVLQQAQQIVDQQKWEDSLFQQAIFTLGALGNVTHRHILRELEARTEGKFREASHFALGDLDSRLKQSQPVISFLLRQKVLEAYLLDSREVKGSMRKTMLSGSETLQGLLHLMSQEVISLMHEHNLGFHEIAGIGVAVGAELDESRRFVTKSYHFPAAFPEGKRTPLKELFEEELQRTTQGSIFVPGRQVPVVSEYQIPVYLINDVEALAIAEARWVHKEGVYIHVGADAPQVWHLKGGGVTPQELPGDLAGKLSGMNLALRVREVIREEAKSRGVTVAQLANGEPIIRYILESAPGGDFDEKLTNLSSVTEVGKAFQQSEYVDAAEKIFGKLFREFASDVADAIVCLKGLDATPFILGGGVLFGNKFLVDEMVAPALWEKGVLDVPQPELQKIHPHQEGASSIRVLALLVEEQLGLPVASGLEERIQIPVEADKRGVILGPGMAERILPELAKLTTAPGERIPVAVIVEDPLEEVEVKSWLKESGFPLVALRNREEAKKPIEELVLDLQIDLFWSKGLDVFVVQAPADLEGLGPYLRAPSISQKSWFEKLQRSLELAA